VIVPALALCAGVGASLAQTPAPAKAPAMASPMSKMAGPMAKTDAMAKAPAAKAPAITRTQLLDAPLEGIKGYDGVMYITDIPAGMAAARHSHPGYEFNYILKGQVSYQIDGQKEFTLKAGQGTYNKQGNIHRVWNPSKTEPAQLVAVLIKQEGKDLAYPAK
jgi:quercetin dioxygenase-like cupin family protein